MLKRGLTFVPQLDGHPYEKLPRQWIVFAAGVFAACAAQKAQSQILDPIQLGGQVACVPCAVKADLVTSLGSRSDPFLLGRFSQAARQSSGSYVASDVDMKRLLAFDGKGKYTKAYNRIGSGPGELSMITMVVAGPGDSVHAYDLAQNKIVVFTPDLEFSREFRLPTQAVHIAVRSDGAYMVTGTRVRDSRSAGYPVHVFTRSGLFLKSFGSAVPSLRPESTDSLLRFITCDLFATCWTSAHNRVLLERWNAELAPVAAFSAKPAWFEEWAIAEPRPIYEVRPQTTLGAPMIDADGLLWVLGSAPIQGWRPATVSRQERQSIRYYRSFVAARIDIFDTRTTRYLATGTLQLLFGGWVDNNRHLYSWSEDEEGYITLDIWHLSIAGQRTDG